MDDPATGDPDGPAEVMDDPAMAGLDGPAEVAIADLCDLGTGVTVRVE